MANPSSEKWGDDSQRGKYPIKIYTVDGVLIYQEELGRDNTAKIPLGGVIATGSNASSVIEAIANPIVFYGGNTVINQDGHSGDLYNYYWTSYSRGTDGRVNTTTWTSEPNWHNAYLDGYIPLRAKSIYDPCPYLYRIPSNGTYNQIINTGWIINSCLGGVSWNLNTLGVNWLSGLGLRNGGSGVLDHTGREGFYYSGTINNKTNGYLFRFSASKEISTNNNTYACSYGFSVRCIEGSLRSE